MRTLLYHYYQQFAFFSELALKDLDAFDAYIGRSENSLLGLAIKLKQHGSIACFTPHETNGDSAADHTDFFSLWLAEACHQLGFCFGVVKRYEEAAQSTQLAVDLRFIEADPRSFTTKLVESYNQLGRYLLALEQYEKAVKSMQAMIKIEAALAVDDPIPLNPHLAYSHHELGRCLAKLGRHTEAVDSFRKAVILLSPLAERGEQDLDARLAGSHHALRESLNKLKR